MWNRSSAFAVLICLLWPSGTAAQPTSGAAGARLRLTGVSHYDVPGLITLNAGQVTGAGVISDVATYQVRSASGSSVSVLKPGTRLIGWAVSVTPEVLMFMVDGQDVALAIPLDSIATIQQNTERGHRHLVRGILVGVGAFYGIAGLIFAQCGLGCDDSTMLLAVAGGGVAGTLAGRRREKWVDLSTANLLAQFHSTGQ